MSEQAERHEAFVNPVDGGWNGYQAACHDCEWRGPEVRPDKYDPLTLAEVEAHRAATAHPEPQGEQDIGDACGVAMAGGQTFCWQPKGHDGPHGSAQPVEQGEQRCPFDNCDGENLIGNEGGRLGYSPCPWPGHISTTPNLPSVDGGEASAGGSGPVTSASPLLTLLVCSTCNAALSGRQCVNGHNAYPAKRIEVVPASSLTTANQQIEGLKAELASQEDFQEHVLIEPRVKAARRAMADAEDRLESAEAQIEELTRERDEATREASYEANRAAEWDANEGEQNRRAERAESQRDTLREALMSLLDSMAWDGVEYDHWTVDDEQVQDARSLLTPPAKPSE